MANKANAPDEAMSREDLLALTPDRYLAGGYREPNGVERPQLKSLWALAAAEQLRQAGIHPTDLDPIVARVTTAALDVRGDLPIGEQLVGLERALATGGRPLAPIEKLMRGCLKAVRQHADWRPFAHHLGAILNLLALNEAARSAEGTLGPVPSDRPTR
jgi:hypothetical protein